MNNQNELLLPAESLTITRDMGKAYFTLQTERDLTALDLKAIQGKSGYPHEGYGFFYNERLDKADGKYSWICFLNCD